MKNYKTTIGGFLAAIGTALQASSNVTVKTIGIICGSIGLVLLGSTAKDSNVTGGTTPQ